MKTELGYRLVFTVAVSCLVVAAVCVLFVRERKGKGDKASFL